MIAPGQSSRSLLPQVGRAASDSADLFPRISSPALSSVVTLRRATSQRSTQAHGEARQLVSRLRCGFTVPVRRVSDVHNGYDAAPISQRAARLSIDLVLFACIRFMPSSDHHYMVLGGLPGFIGQCGGPTVSEVRFLIHQWHQDNPGKESPTARLHPAARRTRRNVSR